MSKFKFIIFLFVFQGYSYLFKEEFETLDAYTLGFALASFNFIIFNLIKSGQKNQLIH